MTPACARVGTVTVVQTLHLGDVQGGEDGVTGEGHTRVHRGHHPLGPVDGETENKTFVSSPNFGLEPKAITRIL